MLNPFKIFGIKKEEKRLVVIAGLVFAFLNALMLYVHFDYFTRGGLVGAWSLYNNKLLLSGYDPYAYMTIYKWDVFYVLSRHPLISLFYYPFYGLNKGIMELTDNFNAAILIMTVLIMIAACYSVVFMYRVFREVLALSKKDSNLLVAMMFSFATILTSSMSPDHFIFSLFLLTFTLYSAGMHIRNHTPYKWYKAAILFVLTAGVTLTNGFKTLLAVWFVDGKRTFHWKNVLLVLVVPASLLYGAYYYQHENYVIPREEKGRKIEAEKIKKNPELAEKSKQVKAFQKKINGEHFADKGMLKWSDLSAPRGQAAIENFFGESIILHQEWLLKDIYLGRPSVVHYKWWINYVLEGLIICLFLAGLVVGIRDKFMLMVLSWISVETGLHFVLGFGLNEVYIMGCHWLFIIPIAISFLFQRFNEKNKASKIVRLLVGILTSYMAVYNIVLITKYMLTL